MATHRATFTVTCNSAGYGDDDVRLKLPSSLARHAQLVAVGIDDAAAVGGKPRITVRELDADSDGAETPGDTLFYTENWRPGPVTVVSAEPIVDQEDVSISSELTAGGIVAIRTASLRCEVDGASASDVWTVNVYYETAGDYRF